MSVEPFFGEKEPTPMSNLSLLQSRTQNEL